MSEAATARWGPTTMDLGAVAGLGDELLDWRYKGMPPDRPPVRLRELGAQGWDALGGDLPLPLMLLSRSALQANVEGMAAWCRERGVLLAPHGKTTMAPQLFERQIAAGAWAMTAATPSQLRVYRRFGVQRILYANQLLEAGTLRWLAGELARDPAFELVCLADSLEAVAALEGLRVAVLVEMGHADGRTGCRTVARALEVARAVAASPTLELVGIEAFEGTIRAESLDDTLAAIDELLARCDAALAEARAAGLLDGEAIVSAGGSAYFDRVLAAFGGRDDVACVLRSGCYVTQDGGFYEELSPLAGRAAGERRLRSALEVWGTVQSRPQPDLAIANFGKRDVPFDLGLPIPVRLRRGDGPVIGIDFAAEVAALSDQHAHVRIDPAAQLAVGDLLGAEISHPCGAFERWKLLFVVDDARRVVDGVLTFL
jgi:D-serine deaminase-like pyridoxal phosphate-dependent protein